MIKNILLYFMGLTVLLVVAPFFVQAQAPEPVTFTMEKAPQGLKAGQKAKLKVRASLEGNWYLYSIANDPEAGPYPTKFSSANPSMTIAGEVTESKPKIEMDPNFETELGRHSGRAVFTIPIVFSKQAQGSTMIDLEVLYQACNDRVCLPPRTESIMHPVTVNGEEGEM